MPVPSVLADLSVTAGLNNPPGGEDVFPQLDNYLRAHAAFIAQLRQSIQTTKYQIACSDLTTSLTTTTTAAYFRIQQALEAVTVRASLLTASSSGLVTVDVKKNGVSMLSTLLTIDVGEKTSETATTPAVLSSTTLADDDEITIAITVAGTGAKGLVVSLQGTGL